jgi:SAM-dependent methyltransferase
VSTAALFERLAARYDELWTETAIGRAQRNAVWRVIDKLFHEDDRILDIGCGTGEDAAHLAARGVCVHAIDASPAMVARASERGGFKAQVMRAEDLAKLVAGETAGPTKTHERGGFGGQPATGVSTSWPEGGADLVGRASACQSERSSPFFDGALSNFGALNCVEDLAPVARALGALVRPGGHFAICTMGRFCAWETLYYGARFDFKKAFRRLPGRAADVHYPTVRELRADFAANFELTYWTGIGMLVPPSYVKLPARIVNLLARLDRLPFLRACADHRLLIFKRK